MSNHKKFPKHLVSLCPGTIPGISKFIPLSFICWDWPHTHSVYPWWLGSQIFSQSHGFKWRTVFCQRCHPELTLGQPKQRVGCTRLSWLIFSLAFVVWLTAKLTLFHRSGSRLDVWGWTMWSVKERQLGRGCCWLWILG